MDGELRPRTGIYRKRNRFRLRGSSPGMTRTEGGNCYPAFMDLAALKDLFRPIFEKSPAQTAYLFGSRARNDAAPESDVDLMIVADTSRPFVERCKDFFDLIDASPAPVEMLVYTPEEFERMRERGNPFVMKAIEEGKLLYERSAR